MFYLVLGFKEQKNSPLSPYPRFFAMSSQPPPSNNWTNSAEILRVISDHAPVGIIILNDHQILYTNKYFARKTGFSSSEILNFTTKSNLPFIHPDYVDQLNTKFRALQVAKEGTNLHFLSKGMRKNGDSFWMDLDTWLISYAGQRAILVKGLDITAQKQDRKSTRL